MQFFVLRVNADIEEKHIVLSLSTFTTTLLSTTTACTPNLPMEEPKSIPQNAQVPHNSYLNLKTKSSLIQDACMLVKIPSVPPSKVHANLPVSVSGSC